MIVESVLKCFLVFALISATALATAGEPRVYRIALIMLASPDDRPQIQALRDGLKDAGYIEGKNLRLDMLHSTRPDELRSSISPASKNKFDVIITLGNRETKIVKKATQETPIIFMPADSPVQAGFVKSLARPATNLTGITFESIQGGTYGKKLEIFKQAVPTLRSLALLYDDGVENAYIEKYIAEVSRVTSHLGVRLTKKQVESLAEAERVADSLSRNTTDGLTIICSSLIHGSKKITLITRQKRIAYLACATRHVRDGGLLSYSPDLNWIGRRGAWYVDQILRGAKPQDLPVEGPRKFELAINLRTAKEIGVKISTKVLRRADKVIE